MAPPPPSQAMHCFTVRGASTPRRHRGTGRAEISPLRGPLPLQRNGGEETRDQALVVEPRCLRRGHEPPRRSPAHHASRPVQARDRRGHPRRSASLRSRWKNSRFVLDENSVQAREISLVTYSAAAQRLRSLARTTAPTIRHATRSPSVNGPAGRSTTHYEMHH